MFDLNFNAIVNRVCVHCGCMILRRTTNPARGWADGDAVYRCDDAPDWTHAPTHVDVPLARIVYGDCTLVINARQGNVVDYHGTATPAYFTIREFDLVEFRRYFDIPPADPLPDTIDFRNLGYWYLQQGEEGYEPALQSFRDTIPSREMLYASAPEAPPLAARPVPEVPTFTVVSGLSDATIIVDRDTGIPLRYPKSNLPQGDPCDMYQRNITLFNLPEFREYFGLAASAPIPPFVDIDAISYWYSTGGRALGYREADDTFRVMVDDPTKPY